MATLAEQATTSASPALTGNLRSVKVRGVTPLLREKTQRRIATTLCAGKPENQDVEPESGGTPFTLETFSVNSFLSAFRDIIISPLLAVVTIQKIIF